jgi:hypothetical protein
MTKEVFSLTDVLSQVFVRSLDKFSNFVKGNKFTLKSWKVANIVRCVPEVFQVYLMF